MIKKFIALVLALFATAVFAAAVDANKATQAELESVKGIGPAISAKIVAERSKGAFKDWQDMVDRVKGVGENNAAKFSSGGLTVNGTSFAGAPAAAVPAPKKEAKPAAAPPATVATTAPAAAPTASAPLSAAQKKAAKKAEKAKAAEAKASEAAAKKKK